MRYMGAPLASCLAFEYSYAKPCCCKNLYL